MYKDRNLVGLVMVVFSSILFILVLLAYKLCVLGDLITGICTVIAVIIAVFGVNKTIKSNQRLKNKELLNELDQKSEWRKELMNVASKSTLNINDIYKYQLP